MKNLMEPFADLIRFATNGLKRSKTQDWTRSRVLSPDSLINVPQKWTGEAWSQNSGVPTATRIVGTPLNQMFGFSWGHLIRQKEFAVLPYSGINLRDGLPLKKDDPLDLRSYGTDRNSRCPLWGEVDHRKRGEIQTLYSNNRCSICEREWPKANFYGPMSPEKCYCIGLHHGFDYKGGVEINLFVTTNRKEESMQGSMWLVPKPSIGIALYRPRTTKPVVIESDPSFVAMDAAEYSSIVMPDGCNDGTPAEQLSEPEMVYLKLGDQVTLQIYENPRHYPKDSYELAGYLIYYLVTPNTLEWMRKK